MQSMRATNDINVHAPVTAEKMTLNCIHSLSADSYITNEFVNINSV